VNVEQQNYGKIVAETNTAFAGVLVGTGNGELGNGNLEEGTCVGPWCLLILTTGEWEAA
jgi:hypothetical protein